MGDVVGTVFCYQPPADVGRRWRKSPASAPWNSPPWISTARRSWCRAPWARPARTFRSEGMGWTWGTWGKILPGGSEILQFGSRKIGMGFFHLRCVVGDFALKHSMMISGMKIHPSDFGLHRLGARVKRHVANWAKLGKTGRIYNYHFAGNSDLVKT